MPQHFYLDKENLNSEMEKIDNNLYQMLDLAYLHEDMVNTIENLMNDWSKENLQMFKILQDEYSAFTEEEKEDYTFDDFIQDQGRWWNESFDKLEDLEKENLIQRYRLTIACCLHSNSYDEESILESIEDSWN